MPQVTATAWWDMPAFTSNNREFLLATARRAIEHFLETGSTLSVPKADDELLAARGCFVTLRKQKELRGCIGTFDAVHPLIENVIRMAIAAAFKDPRFAKLQRAELQDLRIEISVLGPLEKVESLEEIEIGVHGIQVRKGLKTGTFLPDVAVEQKWSVPEFVMFCAREKAGLDPKEIAQAEISRYTVEKITDAK